MSMEGNPRTNIGKGFQIQDNFDINEADIPNILEIVEHVPMARVLRFVGYNSPVIRYTTPNAAFEAHIANI